MKNEELRMKNLLPHCFLPLEGELVGVYELVYELIAFEQALTAFLGGNFVEGLHAIWFYARIVDAKGDGLCGMGAKPNGCRMVGEESY